jgi:DNA-binding LacI/PurR family transcriptional regulator
MANGQVITADELAQKLELSRTTVSIVLSGRARQHRISRLTEKRVMDAAREHDYRPNAAARQLAGKSSNSIGVLVTSEVMIDLRLIEAMEVLAAERGIRFIVGHAVSSPDQAKAYLHDFRSRGVDGLFCFFHHHPNHRATLLPELLGFQNVVFYERPTDQSGTTPPRVWYAAPDFFEVGRVAVQHLIARGRRRIGLAFRDMLFPYAFQRRRGYHVALQEAGLTVDEALVWVMTERTSVRWTDRFTPQTALEAVDELVLRQGADAIVAVNDLYACCLVNALRQRGRRVPDDVAVVGCDDLEFASLVDPPLTTVDLRLRDVARALTEMMFDRLEGQTGPQSGRAVLIQPELIARGSS